MPDSIIPWGVGTHLIEVGLEIRRIAGIAMLFRSYRPRPPLTDFVDNLWFYSGFKSPRVKECIFPSGTFELVFNLRDNDIRIYENGKSRNFKRHTGAIVAGPYAEPFVTDTELETSVMGVHFKPGGAFPFLGFSADELRGRHVDLGTFWGNAAAEIRERLCEAESVVPRFRLLEQSLISQVFRPLERHSAVALGLATLDRSCSQMTRELARDAALSEKRFIDVFRFEVGLNPRLFTRIRRFQRVLAQANRPGALDWAEAASNHGYFDQSHLIRDFLAFSRFNPSDYARRLAHLQHHGLRAKFNHLPLLH